MKVPIHRVSYSKNGAVCRHDSTHNNAVKLSNVDGMAPSSALPPSAICLQACIGSRNAGSTKRLEEQRKDLADPHHTTPATHWRLRRFENDSGMPPESRLLPISRCLHAR